MISDKAIDRTAPTISMEMGISRGAEVQADGTGNTKKGLAKARK